MEVIDDVAESEALTGELSMLSRSMKLSDVVEWSSICAES